MNDWVKSGEIAGKARGYSRILVKENASLKDVVEKIENKIVELGGKCAFPVDLSINEMAAHYSPDVDDKSVFKKGDLVKVDIGVHVNGCVTDTALTIEVNSDKNKKLIDASEKALEEAIKLVRVGIKVNEIGRVIKEVINEHGFSPIVNLSGHSLDKYMIHAGLTIPNYDNKNETKLKKGQIIAIEPFATTGVGRVTEGKDSGVYGLISVKPVRDANVRKILKYIEEEYKTLPFCRRWLVKKFSLFHVNNALRILETNGIVKGYKILPEESKGLVSQSEHSLIVGGEVLTRDQPT